MATQGDTSLKTALISILFAASAAGAAIAQTAPVGGPDAKGNAPIKHAHTVNDGAAKPGANSFTMHQAMRHIEHSGYSGVTGLARGKDGVWRGTAMKGGASVDVAMDFKGNVTQGMAPMASTSSTASPAPMVASTATATAGTTAATSHHAVRHPHAMAGCNTDPGPNGVACSGRDRNRNGISDKEDKALQAGQKP